MTEQPFLQLLTKLMPRDAQQGNSINNALDKKFDFIINHIEENIAPLILNSSCANKSEIVQQLRQTVENYQVLGKLPEMIGRNITFKYSSKCFFNSANIYFHAPKRSVWCINTLGERVLLKGGDIKIIRENENFTVPVKAFLYAKPDQPTNEITIFSSNTAEYIEALQYFAARDLGNINLRSEIDGILQRAYQYFEQTGAYLENKLSILNHDLTIANEQSGTELLRHARGDVNARLIEAKDSMSKLKMQFKELDVYLREMRMDLLKLSEGRIPEDTPEQAIETPRYVFPLTPFENISDDELKAVKNLKLHRKILANYGDVEAVKGVAIEKSRACLSEYRRSNAVSPNLLNQAVEILELWHYVEENNQLSSHNMETLAQLYVLEGDGGKKSSYKTAIGYLKKADTGYANFQLGKIHEFKNEAAATLEDLKTAEKYYQKALELGHSGTQNSLNRVTGKISNKEQKRRYSYQENQSYSSHSESYSSSSSSSWCFVTTAVCKTFDKHDDCYELTTFRAVRDNWLKKQPGGNDIIQKYYEIAPEIVSAIDQLANKRIIYAEIWETYLKPCLDAIERGDNQLCVDMYITMVTSLHEKYCTQAALSSGIV